MATQSHVLAIPHQPLNVASALLRDAALAAHLATLAVAAMSIGFGFYSLEMARWGMSVLIAAVRNSE